MGKGNNASGVGTSSILDALHLTQGTLHIVMLGLDSAGKSTALFRLKFDQYLNTVPTIGFNCEKVKGVSGRAKVSLALRHPFLDLRPLAWARRTSSRGLDSPPSPPPKVKPLKKKISDAIFIDFFFNRLNCI